MRTDKSEFLKALKRDRVEEEHEDESHAGSEKDDDSFYLHNSNSTRQERDINRNFDENEVPQENGNASVISQQIIRSSTFPQTDVLSSSLEAEHRLLKDMGWQEDSENDETCAPLTEDEMREFQVISEQLQKNGLRKNGILKNGLICDFKFEPGKAALSNPLLRMMTQKQVAVTHQMMMMCEGFPNSFRNFSVIHLIQFGVNCKNEEL